ncbi:MAG: glycerophosphodiester phosphodiesterase [Acidimicrobiia bacterium]
MIVGHRGDRARFPANTLAALRSAAAEVGAVELDVRRAADGRLVLSHDPDLDGHVVASTAWEVLAGLDLGDGHGPASVDEVLAALPTAAVDWEVKNLPNEPGFEADHRIALEVAAVARSRDIVSSFWWPNLDAIRDHHPEVATGLLVAVSVPFGTAVDHAVRHGHRALFPDKRLLRGNLERIAVAHDAGLAVGVWTVNDPVEARRLVEAGADGIVTDDPAAMRRALED